MKRHSLREVALAWFNTSTIHLVPAEAVHEHGKRWRYTSRTPICGSAVSGTPREPLGFAGNALCRKCERLLSR